MDFPGKIAIIGSGSWATAIAKIILTNQQKINWYFRREEEIEKFKKTGRNPSYLTQIKFDIDRINFFDGINDIVRASDVIIFVTPSPYFKSYANKLRVSLGKKYVISAIKGIVPDENKLVSDYLFEEFHLPKEQFAVVSGPCHAEEVAMERLSYLTLGSFSRETAEKLLELFSCDFVKTSISNDVIGIEYASVLKNVYAIASGICNGLNFGDNFQAVFIANAISEMSNFVNSVHRLNRDITDSVYLGDLLVTSYSCYSRNRTFGTMIGRGYSVKQAQQEMKMVAEGYFGTKCISEVNKVYQADMPILNAVYDILYVGKPLEKTIKNLTKKFK